MPVEKYIELICRDGLGVRVRFGWDPQYHKEVRAWLRKS
jgi:hypothetical protein